MDEELGGSPKDNRQVYEEMSPFTYGIENGGNVHLLKNIPVRLYHDANIQWQLSQRRRSFYDMNILPASAMISELMLLGNEEAELMMTVGTGVRSTGEEHPHSMSIMEETEFIRWVLKHLDIPMNPAFVKKNGSDKKLMIYQTTIDTPLGDMIACAVDEGICLLEFHDRRMLPTQIKRIKSLFSFEIIEDEHPHFVQLREQLTAYFAGDLKAFDLPLVYPGSAFQQKVWQTLMTIPYGKTSTYAQQSTLLGDPKAIRAMAKANGDNRIAIIIPCHRVIGSDGSLVGYGGKLYRKKSPSGIGGCSTETTGTL